MPGPPGAYERNQLAKALRNRETIGPIEREGLFQRGLGAYADLLDTVTQKAGGVADWLKGSSSPNARLLGMALRSNSDPLNEGAHALQDWSVGFAPVRPTPEGGYTYPRVDRKQLVDSVTGLMPLYQVAKAVPGAVKHAARDFGMATAEGLPRMAGKSLYKGADAGEYVFRDPAVVRTWKKQSVSPSPLDTDIEQAIDDVASAMSKEKDFHYGLRIIDTSDGIAPKVGDVLKPSRKWVDGAPSEQSLKGTSVFRLRDNNPETIRDVLKTMGVPNADPIRGHYLGDQVMLVRIPKSK